MRLSPLRRWTDRVQELALYLLALSAFLAPVGVSVATALAWIGLVLAVADRRRLPMHAGVWLAIAFAAYVMADGAVAALRDGVTDPLDDALDWVQLLLFVPVAYALRGDQTRLLRMLWLALAGLLLGMLWRLDWGLLFSDLDVYVRSRPGFGFPALVFALFSGTGLLGLLKLRRRCWHKGGCMLPLPVFAWTLVTLIIAQAFLLTLARGAWIALAAVLLAGGLLGWIDARRHPEHRIATPAGARRWLPLIGAAALAAVAVLNAGPIVERLGTGLGEARSMAAGEVDYSDSSSVSLRWHAQRFGVSAWLERPWLGWGPGESGRLIAERADPALATRGEGWLRHLHNSYLELLVQLGVVGLVLWLWLYAVLWSAVRGAWRDAALAPDIGRFLLSALAFSAIWSLFDFHMLSQDWRAFWALLAGACLSAGLGAGLGAGLAAGHDRPAGTGDGVG